MLIAHGLPSLVAALITARWFRRGHFIAAGDVIPFVRTSSASELTSLWNHQVTGSGSTSVEIIRVIEIGFITVTNLLGGSNTLAQAIFYAACAALAAYGTSRLVSVFVASPWVVALAGVLGVVNPFILVQMPNPLFLVAIGTIGLIVAELAAPLIGRPTSLPRLVASTAPVAYLALNPALMAVCAVSVFTALLFAWRYAGKERFRAVVPLWVRSLVWSIGFHLWWIVPVIYVNLMGVDGASFDAVTDVEAWAWAHSENSTANVLTLTAHWGWNIPNIFPWAHALDGTFGQIARWALPVGALLAPFLARNLRQRLAVAMVGCVMVTVFISKGLHEPLASVNLFLYEHVPGLWLLREPSSKAGPVLVLLLVVLFSITVDELTQRARHSPRAGAVAGALVVGAVAFPWPLLSGSVIAENRGPLQSMHVEVPSDWFRIADLINGSDREGKVLILPRNDFYQVTTTWGYHGADAVPLQLLTRPVVQRYPGGYFDLEPGFGAILDRIENELVDGSPAEAGRLMDVLGISHVINRRDVTPGAVNAKLASTEALQAGLNATPSLRRLESTVVGDIYELATTNGIFAVDRHLVASAGDPDDLAMAVGALGPGEVLVDDAGPADVLRWRSDAVDDAFAFTLDEAGRYRVDALPGPRTVYLGATERDGKWMARLEDRSEFTLDDDRLPSADSTEVVLPGAPFAVRYDEDLLAFEQGMAVTIEPSRTVDWLYGDTAGPLTEFGPVGDCDRRDVRTLEALGIAADRTGGDLLLSAESHAACVSTDIGTGIGPVAIDVEYRARSGDGGRLCLYDETERRCVVDNRLEETSAWRPVRAVADLEADHHYQLFLYAVGDGSSRSVVGYRNGEVVELASLSTQLGGEETITVDLASGDHELRVVQPQPATALDSFGEIADCHRFDDRSPEEAGLQLLVTGDVLQLRAAAHSACTSAELDVDAGWQYEISFDYRTVSGQTARFCLWMTGENRCADVAALEAGDGWHPYRAEFLLSDTAGPVELYLYADAGDLIGETVVEFRALGVHRTPERLINVERLDATPLSAPRLTWRADGPGAFELAVTGAEGPFALTMAESDAAGWQLNDLPDGWTARHLESNAYGNTWLIVGDGDADLRLDYRPNRIAGIAQNLSLLTAVLCLFLAFTRDRLQRELELDRENPERLIEELVRPARTKRRRRVRRKAGAGQRPDR